MESATPPLARRRRICALLADLSTSEFDKLKLQERLAKLSGGVGARTIPVPMFTRINIRLRHLVFYVLTT